MLKSYISGVISSFFAALACLLLFTFICVGNEDPRALTGLFGIIAFLLGGVAGSLVSVFLCREAGVYASLATSGTYTLILLILSWCNRSEGSRPVWQSALFCVVCLAISFVLSKVICDKRGGIKNTRKKMSRRIKLR